MSILHVPVTFANIAEWVRRAGGTINQLITGKLDLTGGTLTGDLIVPDEAYGAGWNSSLEVPTKNALYDKIETISGGGVSDGDKGDIVVSSSGTVWDIDAGVVGTTELANDAVTYAKIQNVSATDKLLGRSTAGAGDVEEIACTAAGRALLDDADAAAQLVTLGAQASDATLTALAAHNTNGLVTQTAADTFTGRTITAGSGISVANGDGVAGNPTIAVAAFRGALVKKSADQTGVNATGATTLTWDSETGGYDTDTIHDNSTNPSRLTVPSGATKVRLQTNLQISSSTNDTWNLLDIQKNGLSTYIGYGAQRTEIGSTGALINCATAIITVEAGDYFEAVIQTESDTSITIEEERSWFSMEIIE